MRKMVCAWAAIAVMACATAASAEPWAGTDPSRRPKMLGAGDIDFAVAELCFPYVLKDAAVAEITNRPMVLRMSRPPAFAAGADAFWVGQPDIMVAFEERGGGRTCTISVEDGDPEALRAALETRLAQMPTLTSAVQQIPANTYARRELFCGPAGAPHLGALISTRSLNRNGPKIMVTIARTSTRAERCDGPPPVTPPAAPTPAPL